MGERHSAAQQARDALRAALAHPAAGTAAAAGGALLLHLSTTRGYGIFRDELYYLACGAHLDFGYVDHPPLVALVAAGVRAVLGDSLFALRLLPALAAGATVWAAGALARELGGGAFARSLAALCAATAPVYLSLFSILSMNAFDVLLWTATLGCAARALGGGDPRGWLGVGALAGVGLENKLSFLFLGSGLALGLCLARRTDALRSPWLWAGGALAALLFAPHVAWQLHHGWPTLEFIANATRDKNLPLSPLAFLRELALEMNPATAPLWLAGLAALLVWPRLRAWQALGWLWLSALAALLATSSKPYYLAPAFPVLYAAGSLALSAWIGARPPHVRRWLRPAALGAVLLSAAALAPLAKPLLSEDHLVAYMRALGQQPYTAERKQLGRLPQFAADMHGWLGLAQSTALVLRKLAPAERAHACIYARNYGEAGAIDFYGPGLGLPNAISGHNSYHLWGPGDCDGSVVLLIGGDREDHAPYFASVALGGVHTCTDCMPYEDHLPIWIGRRLQQPLASLWPSTRHLD